MKFDRAILLTLNGLARLFGVLACLVGGFFLISSYAIAMNRALNTAVGILVTTIGIAFLLTKPVNAGQLARWRQMMGRSR